MMAELIHELLTCMQHEARGAEGVERGAQLRPVEAQNGELEQAGAGDTGRLDRCAVANVPSFTAAQPPAVTSSCISRQRPMRSVCVLTSR